MVRLTIAAPPEVVAHMYCSNPIIFILRDLAADS
jgi:hypothetical protein